MICVIHLRWNFINADRNTLCFPLIWPEQTTITHILIELGHFLLWCFSAIPRTTITPAVEGDPHVRVQHAEEEPVCFDIDDEDGSVLDLISDLDTGLEVNGQLISASQKKHVSRLERVGILTPYGIEIGIYPDRVTLGQGFRTLQVFLFDE